MKNSNAFILPSLTEGFSVATIEAMYYQLPLILSDIGGARDIINNNDIGIIVENPYRDIIDMTPSRIINEFCDDQHVKNLADIVSAIENIYKNDDYYK